MRDEAKERLLGRCGNRANRMMVNLAPNHVTNALDGCVDLGREESNAKFTSRATGMQKDSGFCSKRRSPEEVYIPPIMKRTVTTPGHQICGSSAILGQGSPNDMARREFLQWRWN